LENQVTIPSTNLQWSLQEHPGQGFRTTLEYSACSRSFPDPTARPSLSQAQLFLLLLHCYGANTQLWMLQT